jgi:hypothetical protein
MTGQAIVAVVALLVWWLNLRAVLRFVEMRYDHEEALQASTRHACDGTCTGTVTRLVK